MLIKRLLIENYKSFEHFEIDFTGNCNIIVGDNECGKSTILEAIHLCMTGQLNGRTIHYELSPFLFNKKVVDAYIAKLREGVKIDPPHILIELYFDEIPAVANLKGSINYHRSDCHGLRLKIAYNDEFADEYARYTEHPDEIKTIPTEYFQASWYSFSENQVTARSLDIRSTLIDTTSVRLTNGIDANVHRTIDEMLDKKERAGLSLLYRRLKESFSDEEAIKSINSRIKKSGIIQHKDFSVSIDISQKTNWDSTLTSYVDDIPFQYIGKGDQNVIKMMLALDRKSAKDSDVVLIEEPENHLSFSTMCQLISIIQEKCSEKQLILTTHSTYVLNKLGLEKLILLSKDKKIASLQNLSRDTQEYFKKLPGYDTLRLVLAKKVILVEGPSDELFIQRSYRQETSKMPIENGIDVISVNGLSFIRFLEIAVQLGQNVSVVTDNDGNSSQVKLKYKDYDSCENIHICFDTDDLCRTLEFQIVKVNDLHHLNKILGKSFASKEELSEYMVKHKTECALLLFESTEKITIPEYIQHAIK